MQMKHYKNKNLNWEHIYKYKKMPNRKRNLLTRDFLAAFRDELIKQDIKSGRTHTFDYSNANYYNFYGFLEGTGLFYDALEITCEKYHLTNAIFQYLGNMTWYDSDRFIADIFSEMLHQGIIEKEGDSSTFYDDYEDVYEEDLIKYQLIKRHKDYHAISEGICLKESKESVEENFKDSEWELIWLEKEM